MAKRQQNLYLWLTKHHDMKTYGRIKVKLSLCFNWAPLHEGVLGSGVIAQRIPDLRARWRWVVSFTPRPLYPRERAPGIHWVAGWVGTTADLDARARRKIPSPYRNSKPRSSSPYPELYHWAIPAANVWGSGSIILRILNLCSKWSWGVSFTTPLL
jgi:hypothetical protein